MCILFNPSNHLSVMLFNHPNFQFHICSIYVSSSIYAGHPISACNEPPTLIPLSIDRAEVVESTRLSWVNTSAKCHFHLDYCHIFECLGLKYRDRCEGHIALYWWCLYFNICDLFQHLMLVSIQILETARITNKSMSELCARTDWNKCHFHLDDFHIFDCLGPKYRDRCERQIALYSWCLISTYDVGVNTNTRNS